MSFKYTDSSRLLAIDPSLTASGWALYSLKGCRLLAAGVLRPPGPGIFLADRLALLQSSVEELLSHYKLGARDLLITEGPAPLVLNPQSSLKVERVRSIFEAVARSRSVNVPGRVNPRSVQTELMGMRGKQLDRVTVKSWARDTAQRLFGTEIFQAAEAANRELPESCCDRKGAVVRRLPQDIVDAALVGYYAVARIKLVHSLGLEIGCAFQPKLGRGSKAAASLIELHPLGALGAPPAVGAAQASSVSSRRSAASRISARPTSAHPGSGRSTTSHPAAAARALVRRGIDGLPQRRTRRSVVWTEAELEQILKRR